MITSRKKKTDFLINISEELMKPNFLIPLTENVSGKKNYLITPYPLNRKNKT